MSDPRPAAPALGAFAHATVGVASLDEAIAFWTRNFGFEVAAERDGADAGLAVLWGIGAEDIARQALVRTPTATAGALHLVEFTQPAAPVRRGALVFDQLPKNLDVYVRDMSRRVAELKAQGVAFHSDPVTSQIPGGARFREVRLPGHDETNVVLIEALGEGYDACFNSKGFAGVGPLVTIVPQLGREDAFYSGILGMAITLDIRLDGPVIEKMIGLPAGARLALKVYGDPAEPLGRVEVIEYEQTRGTNLFPLAKAPALGTLHVTYRIPALGPLLERLRRGRVALADHGTQRLLYGNGRVLSFHSPAGMRIEVQESG